MVQNCEGGRPAHRGYSKLHMPLSTGESTSELRRGGAYAPTRDCYRFQAEEGKDRHERDL